MKAKIVVGLGFGDEGKGITTDFLCSQNPEKTIVVRHSGGQQAGHTVVKNGVKHVYSNFGSGTTSGVPTYISEYCTIYLNTMFKEKQVLESKGIFLNGFFVHPLAKVTTPADVAYNRINVKNLADGSCGLGVGATMNRNIKTGYKLYAIDLLYPELLEIKLAHIKSHYCDLILNIEKRPRIDFDIFHETFEREMGLFLEHVKNIPFKISDYNILNSYENVIFEGSQGILLDMEHGIFPNVTYSSTTSKNAIEICKKLNVKPSIYYITRCYQTRHGNGWMSNEENEIELINNEQEINLTNSFQGNFRVAELDYKLLNYALQVDDAYSNGMSKHLIVTCLDQRPKFRFDFSEINVCSFESVYFSYSPDSKDFLYTIDYEQ